jgi:hypothetical protein
VTERWASSIELAILDSQSKCDDFAVLYFAAMSQDRDQSFQRRRLESYPIGLVVLVRLISGREIEAQIVAIETTALGTFLHVEFGQEVANITSRQVLGFYDFCFLRARRAKIALARSS